MAAKTPVEKTQLAKFKKLSKLITKLAIARWDNDLPEIIRLEIKIHQLQESLK